MSVEGNVEPRHPGRLWAWFAFVAAAAFVAALVVLVFRNVVTLLLVLLALAVAGAAGWIAVSRRGTVRVVAIVCAVAAPAGGAVALIARGAIDELVVFGVTGAVFAFATRRAFQASSGPQPRAVQRSMGAVGSNGRGRRAVLLMNPKSGGGKVEKFDLVDEAKKRASSRFCSAPATTWRRWHATPSRSADAIGMAGGDGSQAIVAQVAMEHDVPYVCVPAGTRNHLALDLGLDRDDVVGALDAFTDGVRAADRSRRRQRAVFVNNVSLGIYAEIVQSDAYRDAKLETVREMLPELLGPRASRSTCASGPDGRRTTRGPAGARLEQPLRARQGSAGSALDHAWTPGCSGSLPCITDLHGNDPEQPGVHPRSRAERRRAGRARRGCSRRAPAGPSAVRRRRVPGSAGRTAFAVGSEQLGQHLLAPSRAWRRGRRRTGRSRA